MQRLLALFCVLVGLALGACRLGPGAHSAPGDDLAARPEVRYYMIADA